MSRPSTSKASAFESPVSHSDSLSAQVSDFFFKPTTSHTLSVIRIATGLMIAYVHLVWMIRLDVFMGPHALLDNDAWLTIHAEAYKWTYLAHTDSMPVLWTHELVAMVSGLCLGLGFATRIAGPLAWFTTLMTVHRLTGFLFGLDQIVMMLSMYLCIARSDHFYSIDAWIRKRFFSERQPGLFARVLGWAEGNPYATWRNTLATRLIQMHLCVIYLFGGLGKLRGDMWWNGSAMWYSVASYEYQSLDMTWIAAFPVVASIATHATVFWEFCYCFLIWPRFTRPWILGMAVMVHAGIALFLGMVTFGTIMIVANYAFIPAETTRRIFQAVRRWTKPKPSDTELQSARAHP